MANKEIRCAIINHGIRQYALADKLGMTETALSKKLRKELEPDERERILNAISEMSKGES